MKFKIGDKIKPNERHVLYARAVEHNLTLEVADITIGNYTLKIIEENGNFFLPVGSIQSIPIWAVEELHDIVDARDEEEIV